ncbi:MAG: hypothetical protein EON54_11005 [Alcaligenaceae bacterium]|nr:MAG: hypothetical protein EON54_11005 [Alcaligenaceae bacterium]
MPPLPTLARALPAFAASISKLAWGVADRTETRAAVERSKTLISELEAQSRRERRIFEPG